MVDPEHGVIDCINHQGGQHKLKRRWNGARSWGQSARLWPVRGESQNKYYAKTDKNNDRRSDPVTDYIFTEA